MESQRDAAGFNSHLTGSLAVTAPSGGLGSKSVMVALNGKTIQHQLATLDLKSFGKGFAPFAPAQMKVRSANRYGCGARPTS